MDARVEQRNKRKDKIKRNKGFPYKRIGIRGKEDLDERTEEQ